MQPPFSFIREVERKFVFRWISQNVVKSEAQKEFSVFKLFSKIVASIYSVSCWIALRTECFKSIVFIAIKRIVWEFTRIDCGANCECGMFKHFVGHESIKVMRQVEQ